MFRPRLIPVLLLKDNVLVKSLKFGDYRYIGDPINAVKIFNDLKADELVFLDIQATRAGKPIPIDFVRQVAEEADMPFSVGGGLKSLDAIQSVLHSGAERAIIGEHAVRNPDFVKAASEEFGTSSILVCMDVKKTLFPRSRMKVVNGTASTEFTPVEFAKLMEEKGAGELIVQSIDRDGTMKGYDVDLLREISEAVSVPVTALGGAGNLGHMQEVYRQTAVNGFGAGSMFVFHGEYRSVLISYPSRKDIRSALTREPIGP